ncbi:hypothetical protein Vretimale_10644 [Volvox reticuliferus]|uniref:Uncharacterized protein n=1 Tax=Volvox reticuliferus TaxID=1737510 RepID=A0A8J4GF35_9CHLO|nr:hypothetical protein Vretifemale_13814 [Volvox reticuliferus]GIM06368.1 hypothetical protein Vretimale_10644 [Volvox reticuliferus]
MGRKAKGKRPLKSSRVGPGSLEMPYLFEAIACFTCGRGGDGVWQGGSRDGGGQAQMCAHKKFSYITVCAAGAGAARAAAAAGVGQGLALVMASSSITSFDYIYFSCPCIIPIYYGGIYWLPYDDG